MKFSYSLMKKFLVHAPPKAKAVEALLMHSFEAEDGPGDLFEVALPPNRYSDGASHIGIARELSAIFGLKFKNPEKIIVNPPVNNGFLRVHMESPKLVPRYAAAYLEFSRIPASPRRFGPGLCPSGSRSVGPGHSISVLSGPRVADRCRWHRLL